jgi:hypothetical protein
MTENRIERVCSTIRVSMASIPQLWNAAYAMGLVQVQRRNMFQTQHTRTHEEGCLGMEKDGTYRSGCPAGRGKDRVCYCPWAWKEVVV